MSGDGRDLAMVDIEQECGEQMRLVSPVGSSAGVKAKHKSRWGAAALLAVGALAAVWVFSGKASAATQASNVRDVMELSQRIGDGTEVVVLKPAAVFQSATSWNPKFHAEAGDKFIASGAPVKQSQGGKTIWMVPVKQITPVGRAAQAINGAIQLNLLRTIAGPLAAKNPLPMAPMPPGLVGGGGYSGSGPPPAGQQHPPQNHGMPQTHETPAAPVEESYDCNAGYDRWQTGWSGAKKTWCCQKQQKACFDCNAAIPGSWSVPHKAWCCHHFKLGCPTTPPPAPQYDCGAAFSNWQAAWDINKKMWCCEHERKGCAGGSDIIVTPPRPTQQPVPTQRPIIINPPTQQPPVNPGRYDCDAGISNSQYGWSVNKQVWCCRHYNKGCRGDGGGGGGGVVVPTQEPVDCDAGFDKWETGWSPAKKGYCCDHFQRGCEIDFDCDAGFQQWWTGWSKEKIDYCCKVAHRGCGIPPPMTYTMSSITATTTGLPSWTTLTSTTSAGEADPFDCDIGYSNWGMGWSVWKKRWCCRYREKGCPSGEVTGSFHLPCVQYDELPHHPDVKIDMNMAIKRAIIALSMGKDLSNIDEAFDAIQLKKRRLSSPVVIVTLTEWKDADGYVGVRFSIKPPEDLPIYLVRERVTAESLPLIVPAVQRVQYIEKVTETDCEIFIAHGLIDMHTSREPCDCKHGEPKTGHECPGHGGHHCASCRVGFSIKESGTSDVTTCEANLCICDHGTPSEGAGCPANDAKSCATCRSGWHIEKVGAESFCKPNKCTCLGGDAAVGSECNMHGGNICAKCKKGFHVDRESLQCVPNVCNCRNGLRVDEGDPKCAIHEEEACKTCHSSFHLDEDNLCQANMCKCPGGIPAAGAGEAGCFEDGAEVCVSCFPHLELTVEYTCKESACICQDGQALTGEECTSQRGNMCASCDAGYELQDSQCVKMQCSCSNGVPIHTDTCQDTNADHCAKCHDGFRLIGNKCVGNKCRCQHGKPAIGAACLHEDFEVCGACDEGYHHVVHESGVRCQPNACDCQFGRAATPSSDPICTQHKMEKCYVCDPGNAMTTEDYICKAKTCTCSNGIGTRGLGCPAEGVEDCSSCDTDYHLTKAGAVVTSTRRCAPNSGTPAPAFDCNAGFDNRHHGWSPLKKHWCCKEQHVGCRGSFLATEVCEKPDLDATECSTSGRSSSCCSWDDSARKCKATSRTCIEDDLIVLTSSKNGKDDEVVLPGDDLTFPNPIGLCLSAMRGTVANSVIGLMKCNMHDEALQWTYDNSFKQVVLSSANGERFCLGILHETVPEVGAAVYTVKCEDGDKTQRWNFESKPLGSSHGFLRLDIDETRLCLSVQEAKLNQPGAMAELTDCAQTEKEPQLWTIPNSWEFNAM